MINAAPRHPRSAITESINAHTNLIECIGTANLFEPQGIRNYYTWHGGPNLLTHSKIDRCFINWECFTKFPRFSILFANHSSSNHTLIIFNFDTQQEHAKNIPFKYGNGWQYKSGYKQIIEEEWNYSYIGNPLLQLLTKLKAVKTKLEKWNR